MNEHTSHNEQRIPGNLTEETTTVNEGYERWLDRTRENGNLTNTTDAPWIYKTSLVLGKKKKSRFQNF